MKKNIVVIFISSRAYVKGECRKAVLQELFCKNRAKKLGCTVKIFRENTVATKVSDRYYLREALRYCNDYKENIRAFIVNDKSKISVIPDELQRIEKMIKDYGIELIAIY